jgi:hypothetical protein
MGNIPDGVVYLNLSAKHIYTLETLPRNLETLFVNGRENINLEYLSRHLPINLRVYTAN